MKKITRKATVIFLCFQLVFISVLPAFAETDGTVSASAEAYVLYCADNGQIISSKNENKRMKPASTTKLMTSLIALEEAASANKKVKFTKEMIAEGSSMYLQVGDVVTLQDLAAGMMMASGNDAANAAAVAISGSTEKFSKVMNEHAKLIGMENTNFVTPSGLDDENHYSTAYDLALLMTYALENEDFAALTAQKSAAVKFISPSDKTTVYSNHNKLLSMYEYCIGGKTGYTMAAGRCLVSAAKKDGLTLVCVTLNDKNDWNDHISLYNYGFDKLSYYECDDTQCCFDLPCVGGEADSVTLVGEKKTGIVLNSDEKDKVQRKIYADSFLYAPIKQGEICGRIEYTVDGKLIASISLVAADGVDYVKKSKSIWQFIKELFTYG